MEQISDVNMDVDVDPQAETIRTPDAYWLGIVEARLRAIEELFGTGHAEDALNHELAALRLAECAIRRRQNALKPVSSLPPEILAAIFHALSSDIYTSPVFCKKHIRHTTEPLLDSNLGWILVTHVCHRWRTVALADSTLWGTIAYSLGKEWTREMISRCRESPFSYCLPSTPSDAGRTDYLSILTDRISSINNIDIANHVHGFNGLVNSLTRPAPVLRQFSCHQNSRKFIRVLPADLFSGFAPHLRGVDLSSCVPRWESFFFPSLEEFNIFLNWDLLDGPPVHHMHPDHRSFYNSLEHMSNLRDLGLFACMPHPIPLSSDNRTVSLPRLQTLEIAGRPADCVGVLQRLTLPPTTSVTVAFIIGNAPFLNVESPFQAISRRLCERGGGSSQVRMLRIDTCEGDWVFSPQIDAWETIPCDPWSSWADDTFSSPPTSAAFCSNEPQDATTYRALATHAARSLPLENVEVLIMRFDKVSWVPFPAETFVRNLPARIQHLVLAGGADPCLLRALLLTVESTDGSARLPNVKTLTIRDENLLRRPSGLEERLELSILALIREKQATGSTLEKVYIRSCRCAMSWIQELREVVFVDWDGKGTTAMPRA